MLEYNTTQQAFFGGNLWDSRATGYELQSPDANQTQGPPVDAQEMMFPDTACIVYRLSQVAYRPLFNRFGVQTPLISIGPLIRSKSVILQATRDKPGFDYSVTSDQCPSGTTEKVNCWPKPEVSNNEDKR